MIALNGAEVAADAEVAAGVEVLALILRLRKQHTVVPLPLHGAEVAEVDTEVADTSLPYFLKYKILTDKNFRDVKSKSCQGVEKFSIC